MNAEPLLAPSLQYGALGLLGLFMALAFAGGWKVLKMFIDQVISQANLMNAVSEEAVKATSQAVLVMKQITDRMDKHEDNTSSAHLFIVDNLKSKDNTLDRLERLIKE